MLVHKEEITKMTYPKSISHEKNGKYNKYFLSTPNLPKNRTTLLDLNHCIPPIFDRMSMRIFNYKQLIHQYELFKKKKKQVIFSNHNLKILAGAQSELALLYNIHQPTFQSVLENKLEAPHKSIFHNHKI